jgi:hypothetical protein
LSVSSQADTESLQGLFPDTDYGASGGVTVFVANDMETDPERRHFKRELKHAILIAVLLRKICSCVIEKKCTDLFPELAAEYEQRGDEERIRGQVHLQ